MGFSSQKGERMEARADALAETSGFSVAGRVRELQHRAEERSYRRRSRRTAGDGTGSCGMAARYELAAGFARHQELVINPLRSIRHMLDAESTSGSFVHCLACPLLGVMSEGVFISRVMTMTTISTDGRSRPHCRLGVLHGEI